MGFAAIKTKPPRATALAHSMGDKLIQRGEREHGERRDATQSGSKPKLLRASEDLSTKRDHGPNNSTPSRGGECGEA